MLRSILFFLQINSSQFMYETFIAFYRIYSLSLDLLNPVKWQTFSNQFSSTSVEFPNTNLEADFSLIPILISAEVPRLWFRSKRINIKRVWISRSSRQRHHIEAIVRWLLELKTQKNRFGATWYSAQKHALGLSGLNSKVRVQVNLGTNLWEYTCPEKNNYSDKSMNYWLWDKEWRQQDSYLLKPRKT